MIDLSHRPKCLSFSSERMLLRPNVKPLLHATHSHVAFGSVFADVSRLQYTLRLPPIASSQSRVGSASSILVLANCCMILTLTRSCLAWLAVSLMPKSRYRRLVSSLHQRVSICAIILPASGLLCCLASACFFIIVPNQKMYGRTNVKDRLIMLTPSNQFGFVTHVRRKSENIGIH